MHPQRAVLSATLLPSVDSREFQCDTTSPCPVPIIPMHDSLRMIVALILFDPVELLSHGTDMVYGGSFIL